MKQSVVPGARRIFFWDMPDRSGFTSVDFNIRILRADRSFFKSGTIICLRFEHGSEYRNRTLKDKKDVRGKFNY